MVWRRKKPTEGHIFHIYKCVTVIRMRGDALLEYCAKSYYEDNLGATIEAIPNLAKIKAIWKVSRENRDAFTMKHRLPPHYKSARNLYVICECYMDNKIEWQFDRVTPDFIIDDELAYFTVKNAADDMVETLGFGEVVDLNKEGKDDD